MDCTELTAVWTLKMAYQRELWRLEDLIALAQPSPPPLDGMPHASARVSKVEKIAMKIVDAKRELEELAGRIEEQKAVLFAALDGVDAKPIVQRVLKFRYVGCMSFNAIAKQMNYSRRQILRLHDEGLRAVGLDAETMIHFRKSADSIQCGAKSLSMPTNAPESLSVSR